MNNLNFTWIFQGNNTNFPVAVFSSKAKATIWIDSNKVSGILTKYPVDISVYDWAIENKFFTTKTEFKQTPEFKQKFTTAHIEHYHFKDGKEES